MDFTKALEKLEACKFSLDANENATKVSELTSLKIKTQRKLFEFKNGWDKKKRELMLTEAVQKGKNAEQRDAMVELEMAGTPFEEHRELEVLLRMVDAVEHHNETIMRLFFDGAK